MKEKPDGVDESNGRLYPADIYDMANLLSAYKHSKVTHGNQIAIKYMRK